ncbi:hypothetical protein HAHE_24950 [Haloferula helveola]|uniref:Uncharacterized protein n=1 Tax=Haloferula helveola TaxID=490095 RepID=A0ABN6H6L7_9BACT|nr:hypothetical protein HAHE_24950 [Haloferula helveola]
MDLNYQEFLNLEHGFPAGPPGATEGQNPDTRGREVVSKWLRAAKAHESEADDEIAQLLRSRFRPAKPGTQIQASFALEGRARAMNAVYSEAYSQYLIYTYSVDGGDAGRSQPLPTGDYESFIVASDGRVRGFSRIREEHFPAFLAGKLGADAVEELIPGKDTAARREALRRVYVLLQAAAAGDLAEISSAPQGSAAPSVQR